MMLAFGVVAAILEARRSGQGQVVDAAMVDGAASLMTMTYAFHTGGLWSEDRGVNMLDTGAPFYEVYETADGQWFAVGAIERQFYAELLRLTGLDGEELPDQMDRSAVAGHEGALRRRLPDQDPSGVGRHLRRDRRLRGAGALALGGPRAPPQPAAGHLRRGRGGHPARPRPPLQPDPGSRPRPAPVAGQDTDEALKDWGIDDDRVGALRAAGAIG